MLERLAREDFEALVGRTLDIEVGGETVALEVKEARPIANPTPREVPPFALVLRSPTWRGSQGTYRLVHPTHGPLEVFFVPIGPDGVGHCYEAVFN